MKTHTQVGFANPFLICDTCGKPVRYWHDPDRCGNDCRDQAYNYPCEHKPEVISKCKTWGPVEGCSCEKLCIK